MKGTPGMLRKTEGTVHKFFLGDAAGFATREDATKAKAGAKDSFVVRYVDGIRQ